MVGGLLLEGHPVTTEISYKFVNNFCSYEQNSSNSSGSGRIRNPSEIFQYPYLDPAV